jgi:hypothetical protein
MTATFTVGSGCTSQTPPTGYTAWSGTTSFDMGYVESESDKINTGFEQISVAMTTSDQVLGMNILGQTRTISIRGKKTGTLAELIVFANNLKLIANYQLENAADSTFVYKNTLSKMPNIASGITVMMKDFSLDDSFQHSPGELRYSITIAENKGLT